MHLGETLYVLGALVIFSIATLYLNDTRFDNQRIMMETEFKITAMNLAQSFLEEAQDLQFDEVATDTTYIGHQVNLFTDAGALGTEIGESYPAFDDIDDFNGYSTIINTPRAGYTVNLTVSYADSTNLSPGYPNKSFLKIVTVNVTSAFYSDTVKFEYLFSYR